MIGSSRITSIAIARVPSMSHRGSSPATTLTLLLSCVVAMRAVTFAASDDTDHRSSGGGGGSSSQGTLNTDALRKLHFRQAQPPGCRGPGEEGRGRWCEIMSDGGVTIRNVERLHEVVRAGEKKEASGKFAEDSDEMAELRRELIAGRAAAAALKTAVAKFDKGEKTRLARKSTKSGPASERKQREADQFKCRKDLKEQDVAKLKYVCTVTEYKLRRNAKAKDKDGKADGDGGGSGGSDGGATAEMSDDDRCKRLTQWMSKYNSDPTDDKRTFWTWLAKHHPSFEALEKLKEHSLNAGTGSGKVRAAIESKVRRAARNVAQPDERTRVLSMSDETRRDATCKLMKFDTARAIVRRTCTLGRVRVLDNEWIGRVFFFFLIFFPTGGGGRTLTPRPRRRTRRSRGRFTPTNSVPSSGGRRSATSSR